MKKGIIVITVVIFLLLSFVILSGVSLAEISLKITSEDEVLLEKTYTIKGSGLLRYLFLCRASGEEYYKKYSVKGEEEMLSILNDELYADINRVVDSVYKEKEESSFEWSDEERGFIYYEGKDGVWVDKSEIIETLIKNFSKENVVETERKRDRAETKEAMKKRTAKRGEFCTDFSSSGVNRKKNIKRATELIHKSVVGRGETFSYNERVGERTEENGFYPATVIERGVFTQGVGGGVCQVSTTLFAAWLKSGLDVYYSRAHSLPVSYVKPSFDAMVSEDNDLILKNNTNSDVYIIGYATSSSCKFEIFGEEMPESVVLRSETIKILHTYEYTETEDYGIEWANGEKQRIIALPKAGRISRVYRTLYLEGKPISDELIRQDVYCPQPGQIILRKIEQQEANIYE